jgi:hypothetical protein
MFRSYDHLQVLDVALDGNPEPDLIFQCCRDLFETSSIAILRIHAQLPSFVRLPSDPHSPTEVTILLTVIAASYECCNLGSRLQQTGGVYVNDYHQDCIWRWNASEGLTVGKLACRPGTVLRGATLIRCNPSQRVAHDTPSQWKSNSNICWRKWKKKIKVNKNHT